MSVVYVVGLLLGLFLIGIIVLLNCLAYNHAYAMTHFTTERQKEPAICAMTFRQRLKTIFYGFVALRSHNDRSPDEITNSWASHQFISNGKTVNSWLLGSDKAPTWVLMCHAFGSCKSQLLDEASAFLKQGCCVFLIDFPGHGDSEGDSTTLGWYEAEVVLDAMKYCERLQSQILGQYEVRRIGYGQSMGSVALIRAEALYKKRGIYAEGRGRGTLFDALIVENPFDSLLGTVQNRVKAMGIPPWGLAELLLFWGGVQQKFKPLELSPKDDVKYCTYPVLLLHGEDDPWVTPEQIKSVATSVGSGDAILCFFKGHGHGACFSTDPERWQSSVEAFLVSKGLV